MSDMTITFAIVVAVVVLFDALTRENLRRVKVGMTVAEVERLLGRHREINRFRLSGEEVWNWNVENEWPDLLATRFNVHFVDGAVKRTSFTLVLPRNGGRTVPSDVRRCLCT